MLTRIPLYLRGLVARKPGLAQGATIPRIVTKIPAHVAPPRHVATMRELLRDTDEAHLPLTYPYIVAFEGHLRNMLDDRFPLTLMGGVHTRNVIKSNRRIKSNEAVRYECLIDGHRATDKGIAFDLVAIAYVGNELVTEVISTIVSLHKDAARTASPPVALDGPGSTTETWSVSPALARRYAWIAGDPNPIHLSALSARLFGFRASIVHGMWTAGRIASRLADRTQGQATFTCEFKRPILLPAEILYRHWPEAGGLALRVLDKSGAKPHLMGSIT